MSASPSGASQRSLRSVVGVAVLLASAALSFVQLMSALHPTGGSHTGLIRNLRLPAADRHIPGVIEAAYNRMDEAIGPGAENEGLMLASATSGERMLYVLELTEQEIANGGIFQMFYNLSPQYVNEAINAAHQIGANSYAALLARAIARFPGGKPPEDTNARRRALGSMEDPASRGHRNLDPLEKGWHEGTFTAQLHAYIEKHPTEFFSPQ